ncbi:MAG: hypothetical protein R2719_05845 [Micropruina sp.]
MSRPVAVTAGTVGLAVVLDGLAVALALGEVTGGALDVAEPLGVAVGATDCGPGSRRGRRPAG